MEYNTADRYEIAKDYIAVKGEISSLKNEVSQLQREIRTLRIKASERTYNFYKGMLVMMYIPCIIFLIVFIIKEFKH